MKKALIAIVIVFIISIAIYYFVLKKVDDSFLKPSYETEKAAEIFNISNAAYNVLTYENKIKYIKALKAQVDAFSTDPNKLYARILEVLNLPSSKIKLSNLAQTFQANNQIELTTYLQQALGKNYNKLVKQLSTKPIYD